MSDQTELINRLIENRLSDIHTAIPGRIEKYDYKKQEAEVTPTIKRRYANGDVKELPRLSGVPVQFPACKDGSLTFPVKKGDPVLIVFSERAIETWLSKGKVSAPDDPRKFSLTDAIAIPGLIPFSQGGLATDNTSVQLNYGTMRLRMEKRKVALGNDIAEVLQTISDTLQALTTTTVATALGPQPLSSAAVLAQLKIKIDLIKGDL